MNFKNISLALLLSCCSMACKDDPVACTMEFRTVTVTINGPALSTYYTLRVSTGDTIRIGVENVGGLPGVYPILDDGYQSILAGRAENFIFQGFIDDSLVVSQSYGIAADLCHISYVSGPLEVTL
jgi:hypothetical protein